MSEVRWLPSAGRPPGVAAAGQSLAELGLILACIAVVALAGLVLSGGSTARVLSMVSPAM